MPTGTRPERVTRGELVREYRRLIDEEGMTTREVARLFGKSISAVRNLLADPTGEKQRKRRQRYQGTCQGCGKPTTGCNGPGNAPRWCWDCYVASPEARAHAEEMTKWTPELIISRMQEWARIYGEPPAMHDWNPHRARHGGDETRARRFEEADGYWPWFTLVVVRFGSWNAGIESAGFEPRVNNGGGGNQWRRRNTRVDRSHVAH